MPDLDDRLHVLADWAPTLASGELAFGHWVISEPDANGVTQMPWFDYSPEARRFMADVVGAGWVQPFDWMTWASESHGQALIADPGLVATVGADDLQRLLTAIIRGDRFIEGNVVGAYESGMLLAIARRAQALVDAEHQRAPRDTRT